MNAKFSGGKRSVQRGSGDRRGAGRREEPKADRDTQGSKQA